MRKNKFYIIYILTVLLLVTSLQKIYSQASDSVSIAKNTFYAGFANEGAIYSINYDRVFNTANNNSWSYRAGFSILDNAIAIPFGIHFLKGKLHSHFEVSLTIIPYLYKYQSFLSNDDKSDKQAYLVPSIGYRFQKPRGGFFFRGYISPAIFLDPPSDNFWKMNPQIKFLAGCGLGYSF